jgi:hypothetical protein
MPDTRKRILVEPETHSEYMDLVVENHMTQNSQLIFLMRLKKLLEKEDKKLYEKLRLLSHERTIS